MQKQQINFQQERLLNEPTNNQRITNIRLHKQLEYLKNSKLSYEIVNVEGLVGRENQSGVRGNGVPENAMDVLRKGAVYEIKDFSHVIFINDTKILQKQLVIFIPKHYPFQEPLYFYQQGENNNTQNGQNTQIQTKSNQNSQVQQQQPENQTLLSTTKKTKQSVHSLQKLKTNLQSAQQISQVLIWLPKYKILQLIQLIAIKIKQKTKQQNIINKFKISGIFDRLNSPIIIFLIAILLRVLVGLGNYSGKGDWPNLGDFQAHRNWMSITVNRPLKQWYLQTDPLQKIWWRIDYPPVAAYLSYILGSIYKNIQPKAMSLQYGYESTILFTFMRLSVLIVQIFFLFVPIFLIATKTQFLTSQYSITKKFILILLFSLLIKPDIILIDHGHFQYNSLILGLILSAFYCLLNRNYYQCCVYFTIALHSKQMAFYYALAFFAGLIGKTMADYKSNRVKIFGQLLKYGVIVMLVSFIIWLPFIVTGSAHLVVEAIFPVHRGLYQLKVQNFWCISDVIMKWQEKFSKQFLMFLCFLISTILSLPSILGMIFQPSKKLLKIGFFTISMTFFIFSYHVHQKSILLPLLIAPFILQYLGPSFIYNLILAGTIGMYHLLKQDGQWLQYFVIMGFYMIFMESFNKIFFSLGQFVIEKQSTITHVEKIHRYIFFSRQEHSSVTPKIQYLFYLTIGILHVTQLLVPPPARLEYLYHLLFAFYSFCFNFYSLVVCNLILVETLLKRFKLSSSKEN